MKNFYNYLTKFNEDHDPHHEEKERVMTEDLLDQFGIVQPARVMALNTNYLIDGGYENRDLHQDRFDFDLTREEKERLKHEIALVSELGSMIASPLFLLDESYPFQVSENKAHAKNALKNLFEIYEEISPELAKEAIVAPLFELLREEVFDEAKAMNTILPLVMTEKTHHHPEDYKKMHHIQYFIPGIESHGENRWEEELNALLHKQWGAIL